MKKSLLLLVAIAAIQCKLSANLVTVQNAQTVALTFYKANTAYSGRSVNANLVFTKTEADNTVDFYVFDISPKGFVIVAADDNMEPVLGYSSESNFDSNVAGKKGVSYWMKQTASKIYNGIQQQVAADARISNLWTAYKAGTTLGVAKSGVVTPLVTTTWNQEPYYNQYCPFSTADNQRAVTGCVACAMAQIMKFWNYPAHGNGSYSYNDAPPSFSNNYGTQSANFGNTTYNWTNMPASISANNNDIGTLMYHCGVSVAMDYGDDNQGGSGAYVLQSEAGAGNPCAQNSYATYFSYNASAMQGVTQSNYTAAAWVTLLENELSAGRPIQYEGFEPTAGGHTWVCDGFDANNMFHMNWGWGGYDNGYFVITNLNPNPYTFNSNDAALIGIQPLSTTCNVPATLTTGNITSSSATLNWVAVTGAASYGIQYRKVGTTSWSTGTSSTASYSAANLTASTNYEWQVKTVCSSGSSAFTSSATFTTSAAASCNLVTALTSSAITSSSATLGWTAATGATSYKIQYRKVGTTAWSSGTSSTASYHATGLAASTNYEFQVQTVCSAGSSAFTGSATFTTTAAVTCGIPTALTAATITGTSATLTWAAVTGATHYALKYKTTAATNWTTVSSLTAVTYTLTGLTGCTGYQFEVQSTCSSGTSAFSAAASFTTTCAASYCTSKGTSTYEYINKVALGTISNTSGNNNGYGNFTAQSTNLTGGSTVTISLTPGFAGSAYHEYWTVYIDYNHNGSFSDVGEMVAQCNSTSATSATFTIPATALNGSTRMRVQMQYGAYQTNPCASYNYGEVEDYTVNITGNVRIAPDGALEAEATPEIQEGPKEMKVYPNPAREVVTIEYNSEKEGIAIISIYNLAGQKMMSYEKSSVAGFNAERINGNILGSGVYLLELENGGDIRRQRFVISK